MRALGVNVRSLKRFSIVTVAVLAIIATLVWIFGPTDASRLKSAIEQRFPPGTRRQPVETWLTAEHITFDAIDHVGDTIGQWNVLEFVGLTDDALELFQP